MPSYKYFIFKPLFIQFQEDAFTRKHLPVQMKTREVITPTQNTEHIQKNHAFFVQSNIKIKVLDTNVSLCNLLL